MRTLALSDGTRWPTLGLGTWRLGEDARAKSGEVAALRRAVDIGYRLFDTAEMYGEGGAESVLGVALRAAMTAGLHRDDVIVVSKFYPHHADRRTLRKACEGSLRRLGIDRIDLYLLHWRGSTPLAETITELLELQARGQIARWGVSNFDVDDMRELACTPGGSACAANQVYYSLGERGIEHDLLPWQRERAMPVMAYCPIDQGRLGESQPLQALARRIGVDAAQLALAWITSRPGVVAIPKAVQEAHLLANRQAGEIELDAATVQALDELFPPPRHKQPLTMT